MEEKKSGRMEKFLAGKGFYIVLALCMVVIGISIWSIANHSVTGNLDIDSGVTLENGGDAEAVMSEESEAPIIEDMDTENAEEVGVWTQDDVWSEPEKWVWPVAGEVSREYSVDALKYDVTMADWRTHDGLDIAAELGAPVCAAADGKVSDVEKDDLYGTTVTIDHGAGMQTVYSNLEDTPTVEVGDSVKAGDTIGAIGSSAICEVSQEPHVHIALIKDGNSVNPQAYLPG